MRLKYLIPFFFFIDFAGLSQAQDEIRFNHLTTDNGLSNNTVSTMAQDNAGYIWFGTLDGLCRYDGNSVITYLHKSHDSNSVSDNQINCLCQEKNNLLWIGTTYGLNSFNPITGKFKHYFFDKWSKNSRNNSITNISVGVHQLLWVVTGKGLYRMNIDSEKWISVKFLPSNSDKVHIRSIVNTKEGRLFVATDSNLFYSDNDGGLFCPVKNFNQFMHGKYISSLDLDSKGRLWIGLWESSLIYQVDSRTFQLSAHVFDTIKPKELNANYASRATLLLNDSTLMIGAIISGMPGSGGLYLLNINTGRVLKYKKNEHDPYSLSNNHIYCLFTDKQKTIWLGTTNGVNYFNYQQQSFHELPPPDNKDSSVFSGYNTMVAGNSKNTFWIYGDNGDLFYYQNTSSVPRLIGKVTMPKLDSFIRCIYPSGDSVLLGTEKGFVTLKIANNNFNNLSILKFKYSPIDKQDIMKILVDKAGSLWVAVGYGGVYEYIPSKNETKHYLYKDEPNVINPPGTGIDAIRLAEDKNGNIWVGTDGSGFCCIYPSSGKVEWNKFLKQQKDIKSLGGVNDIFCDTNNIVYVATSRAGLVKIDIPNERINLYTVDDGLSNDEVSKIISGDKDYLWLLTKKGLSCYDKSSAKFHNYFKANGLFSDVFHFNGGIFNSGKVIFNSPTCIQYFYPSDIIKNTFRVFPGFTSMQVNNKEYEGDLSKRVFLGYRDNIISFTFSAFDFINNTQDKFAYKLEGLDEDWNYCETRRYAEYTNLPGGDYTLKCKVQTTDGNWIETAQPIYLHIATPYWKTSWFFLLCGLAAFALGYFFYYLKMQRKLEAEKLRTRLAMDLHDDIGSSLSSISILSDLAGKNTATSSEEKQAILNKISESSHKTMESMKDIVWAVNPENDTIDSLLTRMRVYCSEILEPKYMEYIFKVGGGMENIKLSMEQRRNFYLIFKEAVHNSAKYSKANNINITIYKSDHNVEMKISDNGTGFNIENEHSKGNGLKNMAERTKAIKGNIRINGIEGVGTTIILDFPLT